MEFLDLKNHKFDASDGAFFEKQLEYISNKVILEKKVDLDYALYIPIDTEMPVGATNFTWTEYTASGRAKIISDSAKNIPTVGLGGIQHTITAKPLALGMVFTKFEILRARFAGVPLEARKYKAVVRGIEELLDELAWVGDANYNIQGFIGYPGITTVTPVDGSTGGSTRWSTKTAEEMLKDMDSLMNGVQVGTNWIEKPNTILLPPVQYKRIAGMQKSTATDTTVLEWFLRNNPGVTVAPVRRLAGAGLAGGDSQDLAIAYVRDRDHLIFELPLSFEQDAPQLDGLETRVNCYAIAAGCIVYYPLSIAQLNGL